METQYNIGYIDEDLGQLKKYQRKLREFGFNVIGYEFHNGMTLQELMLQVYKSDIDLLLIDFKLNETNIVPFNGDSVEKEIYDNKPMFPHIIFTNKVDQAEPEVDDLKIIFDKELVLPSEDDTENPDTLRFVNVLIKSIQQYQNYITKRKDIISDLLDKEDAVGLDNVERNLLLSTQRELSSLDKIDISEVPENLKSIEELDKITKAREDAENYIESLLKNNTND